MLSWTIPIFRTGETTVRLHPTFFLLLAIVGLAQGTTGGANAALRGVVFISLLFACVLLHELGHVFAARRYGIKTPDVTLWPFGGVASLERMPERPGQEIVIALAGPAVNVVIAILLTLLLGARFDLAKVVDLRALQASLWVQLAAANIMLVVFNLIPAFPMDGGRVLRALLASRLGHVQATQWAAMIGQGIAILFGLFGLMGNPMLVVIAIFIFLAASSEVGFVKTRDVTRHHCAGDAMITQFASLPVGASTDDAAQLLLQTTQQEFPVVDDAGRARGMVLRHQIVEVLGRTGGTTPVREFMKTDLPTFDASTSLEHIFGEMQKSSAHAAAIQDSEGVLAGYITPENVAELIMIRGARVRKKPSDRNQRC